MTKKDFFILIIRVFGLYWLVQSVVYLIPSQIMFMQQNIGLKPVLWLIVAFILIFGLLFILLVLSPKLVDLLKLNNGFDDDRIELGSIKTIDFYRIGIFFVGGIFILRQFTRLIMGIANFFNSDLAGQIMERKDKMNLISGAISVFIGFLLITNSQRISSWFTKREESTIK